MGGRGLDLSVAQGRDSRVGGGGSYECGNEASVAIKCREIFDQPRSCYISRSLVQQGVSYLVDILVQTVYFFTLSFTIMSSVQIRFSFWEFLVFNYLNIRLRETLRQQEILLDQTSALIEIVESSSLCPDNPGAVD
jgi:hypothetical protein